MLSDSVKEECNVPDKHFLSTYPRSWGFYFTNSIFFVQIGGNVIRQITNKKSVALLKKEQDKLALGQQMCMQGNDIISRAG